MAVNKYKDVEQAGEIWHQRLHKLREIWQDEGADMKRATKAFLLWDTLKNRILTISREYARKVLEHQTPFPSGGIVSPSTNDGGGEYIINRKK